MKKIFTAKIWKLMKFCAAQGMIAVLICGVTCAFDNYAQLLDREVTISINDVSFDEAMNELAIAVHAKFAYSPELLNVQDRVSIDAKGRKMSEVLDELLLPRNIKYVVHADEITISLKPADEKKEERSAAVTDKVKALVTGTVTDEARQPMAGVNIVVKETLNGTTTDSNGKYALDADPDDILVYSFIGFSTVEIQIGTQTVIDVTLIEDIRSLSEVTINVGYWEVKQKEQTGNTSRVTAEQIQKQPVNNPLQALQGRMTGVYIQQNTGMAGGGFNIQIRGQNSLRTGTGGTINGNLPLYIVDGIPFTSTSLTSAFTSSSNLQGGNPLSTINPADIESIEVLKDADATAIYGSRGANGVVLITTKKAKAGKTKFELNFSRGVGQVSNTMDLLSTPQYLEMRNEAVQNDDLLPLLQSSDYDVYWPDLKLWDPGRYTDWQEKLIGGTAHITNGQFSVSGGSAKTQFLFAGGYYRETTVFPGDNAFQRGSGRFHINHTSENNRFNIASSVNYTTTISDIPSIDFTSLAVTLAPNAPALYDANGELNWEDQTWTNPLAFLERKYSNNIDNLVANATMRYEVLPGLELKTGLGYTNMQVRESSINPLSAYSPMDIAGRTGSTSFADSYIKTWIAEPQISYSKKISEGDLNILVGSTFQESLQSGKAIEGTGYSNDALLENIDAATDVNIVNSTYSQYLYAAVFARINYNWLGKYIINLTGRRDGSSRFGPGNQFANFGAVGVAWIFSNEQFINSSLQVLSFGKLRASYGSTGSDAIGNYQYLNTFSPTPYPYNGTGGLVLSRLNNPDYSWETNRKGEVGIDLNFFKDRIAFSASYYLNRSSNQLVGLPLPVITGQSSVQFNLPASVQNSGLEFQLSSTNISHNKFEWTTSFNITIPRNKLLEFPDIQKFSSYRNRYEVGQSLYIYKAVEYTGVDPTTGVYTFKDRDEDGVLSPTLDIVGLKETTQQYYGGINNSFKYKGIQLDVFFQFVKQTGRDYMDSFSFPGDLSNQPTEVMNRWQQEGDITDVQRFTVFDPDGTVTTAFGYNAFSDHAITDASFIRLKNVSLSWQLPSPWMQKIKVKQSSIYLQGQNLLTFTKYLGLDPETMNSQSLPPLRMITAGLQITL